MEAGLAAVACCALVEGQTCHLRARSSEMAWVRLELVQFTYLNSSNSPMNSGVKSKYVQEFMD